MSEKIRRRVRERLKEVGGEVLLGESASYNWIQDPARLLYSLSRYKFVSRMFSGADHVLEVGSADGFGAYLVSKSVSSLTCVDIDETLIHSAQTAVGRYSSNIIFEAGNITDSSFLRGVRFDGIYLLDVLEHISADQEDIFLRSLCHRLTPFGSMIIGMPSLESQVYASEISKMGHINCKTHEQLLLLCRQYFHVVHMFGANDEIVHTAFPPLAHYRLALCSAARCHHQL